MRPMPKFKIRCSMIHAIMGRVGLTESQTNLLAELQAKPKLTDKQAQTLADLEQKLANPKLPDTCTSYLKKWYAENVFSYTEEIQSKYLEKGNWCEAEAIELVSNHIGLFGLEKNEVYYENEYLTGTPDIISTQIGSTIDTKCPWDARTYLERVLEPMQDEYKWQGIGYMDLTGMTRHLVAYCLIDTPDECNYGMAIDFDASDSERVHIKSINHDQDAINEIYTRVDLCRSWLDEYNDMVLTSLLVGRNW